LGSKWCSRHCLIISSQSAAEAHERLMRVGQQ
jgi:hypothetical protein